MKVTIIGAGNMGRGIGTRLVAGGNDVEIVDRDPDEARALADELGGSATAAGPDAELGGEIVVLAVYYASAADAVTQYRDRLAGKILVDVTIPADWDTLARLVVPEGSSGAQELAKLLSAETRVVKAFNTTFAQTLVAGEVAGQPLDVLIAGDDADAKAAVASLVEAGGLRPIDAGGLGRARQLEELMLLHIALQEPLGTGFGSAVKLVW